MAEEVKSIEPQKEDAGETAREFNRQVNYFIMRYMWQVICGRTSKGVEDTIYNAFQTSRERYTRVINTGKIRYGRGELKTLSHLTGLDEAIFTGDRMFRCSQTIEQERVDSQTKETRKVKVDKYIPQKDWEAMFQWRKDRKGEGTPPVKPGEVRLETPQAKICKQLKGADTTNVKNWDFYQLCYYLTHRSPAPIRQEDETLRSIETGIQNLTFSLLDRCQISQLQKLQKLMKEKQQIINSMIVYKNAREGEKRRNKEK